MLAAAGRLEPRCRTTRRRSSRCTAGAFDIFNECEFFEAHETWEELWTEYRGPARRFYQGLIQAAVALHHFGNGNIRGAKKVYLTSRGYLDDYRPAYLGLDLEAFLAQYERCFAEVLASTEEFPRIEIDPELIPEIHLDPALAATGERKLSMRSRPSINCRSDRLLDATTEQAAQPCFLGMPKT